VVYVVCDESERYFGAGVWMFRYSVGFEQKRGCGEWKKTRGRGQQGIMRVRRLPLRQKKHRKITKVPTHMSLD
jgi:hypothetical protein